jgi:hypothetical protein
MPIFSKFKEYHCGSFELFRDSRDIFTDQYLLTTMNISGGLVALMSRALERAAPPPSPVASGYAVRCVPVAYVVKNDGYGGF